MSYCHNPKIYIAVTGCEANQKYAFKLKLEQTQDHEKYTQIFISNFLSLLSIQSTVGRRTGNSSHTSQPAGIDGEARGLWL